VTGQPGPSFFRSWQLCAAEQNFFLSWQVSFKRDSK
jgi:hypothetical protein